MGIADLMGCAAAETAKSRRAIPIRNSYDIREGLLCLAEVPDAEKQEAGYD